MKILFETQTLYYENFEPREMFPYLNDASTIIPVTVTSDGSEEERNKLILKAAIAILPDFFKVSRSKAKQQYTIRTLSGGLSNALYTLTRSSDPEIDIERADASSPSTICDGVTEADDELRKVSCAIPTTVLVRVNFCCHDAEDLLVDRDRDVQVMCELASVGSAPAMYGRFENGRIEEFYQGCTTLSYKEMAHPRFAPQIAQKMARIHMQTERMIHKVKPLSSNLPKTGEIWSKLRLWLDSLNSLYKNDETSVERQDLPSLSALNGELVWLENALTSVGPTQLPLDKQEHSYEKLCRENSTQILARNVAKQIVLCHMDCQSLNIIRMPSKKRKVFAEDEIKLIDFEYAAYNPCAADIANTFCEHCDMNNLNADFEKQYPTKDQQDVFIRAYLNEAHPELYHQLSQSKVLSNEFLNHFRQQVNQHALISHFMWCLWSMIQSLTCPLEFDFVKYAQIRFEGYTMFKSKYFAHESIRDHTSQSTLDLKDVCKSRI